MKKCESCTKESCEYTEEDGGFDVFTALKDPAARPEEPEPGMAADLFMSTLAEDGAADPRGGVATDVARKVLEAVGGGAELDELRGILEEDAGG